MTWNHRVMKRKAMEGDWYAIHEVFYLHAQGESPRLSCTEGAVAPGGETLEELREELQRMLKCLDRPVLDYDAKELKDV